MPEIRNTARLICRSLPEANSSIAIRRVDLTARAVDCHLWLSALGQTTVPAHLFVRHVPALGDLIRKFYQDADVESAKVCWGVFPAGCASSVLPCAGGARFQPRMVRAADATPAGCALHTARRTPAQAITALYVHSHGNGVGVRLEFGPCSSQDGYKLTPAVSPESAEGGVKLPLAASGAGAADALLPRALTPAGRRPLAPPQAAQIMRRSNIWGPFALTFKVPAPCLLPAAAPRRPTQHAAPPAACGSWQLPSPNTTQTCRRSRTRPPSATQ